MTNQNDSNNSAKLSIFTEGLHSDNLEGETATHTVVPDWRHMRRLQACLKQTQELYIKIHQKAIHQSLSDAAIMTQLLCFLARTSCPEYVSFLLSEENTP